jgi:hypothetical protein
MCGFTFISLLLPKPYVFLRVKKYRICCAGIFKDMEHALQKKGRVLNDVRSASFHPVDPVLACGLFQGGVVFLCGASHATLFVNWETESKRHSYDRTVLSVQWNVSSKKKAAKKCYGLDLTLLKLNKKLTNYFFSLSVRFQG